MPDASCAPMGNNQGVLKQSRSPLTDLHDLAVLDLDGVLYVGADVVPGAVAGVQAAASAGCRPAYVTNNAARTPAAVAAHLTELGFSAGPDDVVTSAQAAASVLARELSPGAAVYVIGGEGLEVALEEVGLRPVTTASGDVAAVAQGYGPEMPWRRVIDGAILVRSGLPWVASNTDMTIPTSSGPGPGNGTLVDLVARYAARTPVVAGKPEPPLFEQTRERMGADAPIVIGDRLDTDIAGGVRLGWSTLLVLTGVTGLAELVAASADQRPQYVGADLSALTSAHPAPEAVGGSWQCGGWQASTANGALAIGGEGAVDDWWRVAAAAGWAHLDATGAPVDIAGVCEPR